MGVFLNFEIKLLKENYWNEQYKYHCYVSFSNHYIFLYLDKCFKGYFSIIMLLKWKTYFLLLSKYIYFEFLYGGGGSSPYFYI